MPSVLLPQSAQKLFVVFQINDRIMGISQNTLLGRLLLIFRFHLLLKLLGSEILGTSQSTLLHGTRTLNLRGNSILIRCWDLKLHGVSFLMVSGNRVGELCASLGAWDPGDCIEYPLWWCLRPQTCLDIIVVQFITVLRPKTAWSLFFVNLLVGGSAEEACDDNLESTA